MCSAACMPVLYQAAWGRGSNPSWANTNEDNPNPTELLHVACEVLLDGVVLCYLAVCFHEAASRWKGQPTPPWTVDDQRDQRTDGPGPKDPDDHRL